MGAQRPGKGGVVAITAMPAGRREGRDLHLRGYAEIGLQPLPIKLPAGLSRQFRSPE